MTGTVEVPPRGFMYRTGDLLVDPLRQRVLRDGVEIALPRLSFELLLALVEAAPGMLSTAQLLDRVWPGLVVNTETVAQRVKLLRAALGDDPRAPRYLQVLRGRGYRLVPPVQRVDAAVAEALPAPTPPLPSAPAPAPASSFTSARRSWLVACGLAVCAVLLAWWWLDGHAAAERSIAVMPFRNIGNAPGGEAFTEGVPKAVMRELHKLKDAAVIADTSSFLLADRNLDPAQVGAALGARYILYGSVEPAGEQSNISAQLVDASTGKQLWSQQFGNTTREGIGEIARKVAETLELSLDAMREAELASRDPDGFRIFFEYLQADRLLSTERVEDLHIAQQHLEQVHKLDNTFADAYVDLAYIELRLAEFEPGGNRQARLDAAVGKAGALIDKALDIDVHNGRAWLQRAALRAIASDAGSAEQDYRRGLALLPSNASGHEGLAAVLYEDPRRHEEALAELERARRLDPLVPRYEVTLAVFKLYGRSDLAGAEAILQRVVEQHPQYAPALVRLGEVKLLQDQTPEGIRLLEDSLELDASIELARRLLVNAYLDLHDEAAAESVLREAPGELPVRALPLQLYRRQWREAGETAYAAVRDRTAQAFDENSVALALREHALLTGEHEDAVEMMEELAQVTWDEDDEPEIPDLLDMKSTLPALAALLRASGEEARARRLLQATMERIDLDSRQRGGMWTGHARTQALALLGDADGAISALRKQLQDHRLVMKHWMTLGLEPALDPLRQLPAFKEVLAQMDAVVREQKQRLELMRSRGEVPLRR